MCCERKGRRDADCDVFQDSVAGWTQVKLCVCVNETRSRRCYGLFTLTSMHFCTLPSSSPSGSYKQERK